MKTLTFIASFAAMLILMGSYSYQAHAHFFTTEHDHNEIDGITPQSEYEEENSRQYESARDRRSRQTSEARQRRDSARERRQAQRQSIRNLREQRKQARRSRPRY